MDSVRIVILVDRPRLSAAAERCTVWGGDLQFLEEKCRKAGIPSDWFVFESLTRIGSSAAELNLRYPNATVLVPLDELPLKFVTGLKSISKWHLSPLDCLPEFRARKCIPTWHPDQVKRDFPLGLYVELALRRAREECETVTFARKPHRFLLNPTLEETHATLDELGKLGPADWLSVDIETGRGQINTVGFAWSESDAIAIGVLPDRCGEAAYYELWSRIGSLLRGPTRKVMQNGIYEILYFARYGCELRNFAHDTMIAQKFLWPEFDKGLANVGRFYTREPYWKDSGRIESEEGKTKDWGAIRDWSRHYDYNCKDTSGTYEAMLAQRADLAKREKLSFYDEYLMRVARCTQEMCLRGLPVSASRQTALVAEYEAKVAELAAGLSKVPTKGKKQISAITRTQKMDLLRGKGYVIPKVKDKATGKIRESVDELSLKKMLAKHPDDTDIPKLLKMAEFEKALSSYLRVETDPLDGFVRFMLDPHGTETGRMSSSLDPWGRGLNAQTLPYYAKPLIEWNA